MLAIIHHQDRARALQAFEHLDARLGAGHRQDQERFGDRRPNLAVALQRRQIDQPRAIGKRRLQHAGEFDRKARLAHAAGTNQGQEPRFKRHLRQLVELALAAQERAQVCRQVAAGAFAFAPDRRERGRQVGRRDLVNPNRFDALEMVFAEVGQLERRPHEVGRQPLHGHARQQDLIGVGRALQSRRRRQRGAEEIIVPARPRQPGVDAEADLQPPGGAPGDPAHLALCFDGGLHRIERPVEDRQHAVAGRAEWIAGMTADRVAQNLVVQIHGVHHVVGIAAQQRGRAHDIGGEDRPFPDIRRCFRRFGPGHHVAFNHEN